MTHEIIVQVLQSFFSPFPAHFSNIYIPSEKLYSREPTPSKWKRKTDRCVVLHVLIDGFLVSVANKASVLWCTSIKECTVCFWQPQKGCYNQVYTFTTNEGKKTGGREVHDLLFNAKRNWEFSSTNTKRWGFDRRFLEKFQSYNKCMLKENFKHWCYVELWDINTSWIKFDMIKIFFTIIIIF